MNSCPICNTEIRSIKRTHHAIGQNHFGGRSTSTAGFQSYCSSCKITLYKVKSGRTTSKWVTSFITKDLLTEEVKPNNISSIETKLRKYPRSFSKWKSFISSKRNTDKIFRYYNQLTTNMALYS